MRGTMNYPIERIGGALNARAVFAHRANSTRYNLAFGIAGRIGIGKSC